MDLETVDHEPFIDRAIDFAETAADRGDDPFGALLVRGGDVRMEATNRTVTEDDLARHPELTLARRAAREWTPAARARTVLYTSTEPCAMCATGVVYAGLGAVVYGVAGQTLADHRDGTGGIPCGEVVDRFGADVEVVGPIQEAKGLAVHEAATD